MGSTCLNSKMGCEQSFHSVIYSKQIDSARATIISPIVKGKGVGVLNDTSSGGSPIKNVKVGNLTLNRMRSLLQEYMNHEERIKHLEQSDPLTVYYVKKSQLQQIERLMKEKIRDVKHFKKKILEHEAISLDDRTNETGHIRKTSARGRGATVRNVLMEMGNKILTKQDHMTIVWINKLEIAVTELEMLQQEKVLNRKDAAKLLATLFELKEEYGRQYEILEELGVVEGGENEMDAQNSLIELESRRVTISETFERWKEARLHLVEVCSQFSNISYKLEELGKESAVIDAQNNYYTEEQRKEALVEEQYQIGEEIRDGLVVIWQSLENIKFHLGYLPYCTDAERATLHKAMAYLFIDLKSEERRQHAKSCYEAFHKRTVALLVWVDKTIQVLINPALTSINEDIYAKSKALSTVRINSIQEKFPALDWNKLLFSNLSKKKNSYAYVDETENKRENNHEDVWNPNPKLLPLLDKDTKRIFTELEFSSLVNIPEAEKLFGFKLSVDSRRKFSIMSTMRGDSYSEADTMSARSGPSGNGKIRVEVSPFKSSE